MIRTHCLLLVLLALFSLVGCNKTPAKPKDAVEAKLQELAGGDATNCGRLPVQADKELKTASDCATEAAQKKHPFYVGYDMPGMSVGVAGNSTGSLFTVEAQGEAGAQQLTSGACPAGLRVASSGRVTCFAPGSMGTMGVNPHGGMGMPAANPHGDSEPKKP